MEENAVKGIIALITLLLILIVGGYIYKKEMKSQKRLKELGKDIKTN